MFGYSTGMDNNTSTSTKTTRRRGPVPRLRDVQPFNTNLPLRHRRILEQYANERGIALAAALRVAIEQLEKNIC